ncbi:unnamed protein product [Toxocara canis]|uniref:Guanine nucleotide exchange factor DBS-like spectrin-like domain-containing protein n=2 Tax=Toxocara canis TaxID=6265 RepID=A0A183UNV4_TOXCA|nr:unnamed protein product [Toxocara canis]
MSWYLPGCSLNFRAKAVEANKWCKRGVDLLTTVPVDISPTTAAAALTSMDDFIAEGQCLKLDALNQSPNMNNLILLTTTETSTLLAQVAERIDDIRRMSAARRDALQKLAGRESRKPPVQVVSPEKLQRRSSSSSINSPTKDRVKKLVVVLPFH